MGGMRGHLLQHGAGHEGLRLLQKSTLQEQRKARKNFRKAEGVEDSEASGGQAEASCPEGA